MKKIIALILAAMMLVVVFASCGDDSSSDSSDDKSTTSDTKSTADTKSDTQSTGDGPDVSDYTKYEIDSTGKGFDANVIDEDFGDETGASLKVWGPTEYVKILQKQCDRFCDKFSDKNISIKVTAQSESDAGTKLQTDKSASADVFGFASDQLTKLVNSGCILPLPVVFAADVYRTNDENAVAVCDGKKNGDRVLYAYPETGNGYFLVYDKDVVTENDAKTLEGVLKACKDHNKKFIMDVGNGYYSCMFVFTGGLSLEGLDKDGQTQLFNDGEYDPKEVAATMKAFSKLMHDYSGTFVSNATSTIPSGMTKDSSGNSKCGAGIDGNWDTAGFEKALGDKFGACKLPTINVDGEDKQIVSMYGYKMVGVNSGTKYPNTAHVLAYYLASEECQIERAKELGWSPTNVEAQKDKDVKNSVAIQALIDQSAFSVPQVNVGSIWDPLKVLGTRLMEDGTDPDSYDFEELLENTLKNINM